MSVNVPKCSGVNLRSNFILTNDKERGGGDTYRRERGDER